MNGQSGLPVHPVTLCAVVDASVTCAGARRAVSWRTKQPIHARWIA